MSNRLLLVEDDASVGLSLKERLEKENFQVDWSRSTKDARGTFEKQTYDLVILDVGLPDGNGFELAKWIRSRSPVPFIFVTAQGGAEDRLQGYELGAEEYIPKPFHLKEFLIRIRHVLKTHRINTNLKIADIEIDLEAMSIMRADGHKEFLAKKDFLILKQLIEQSPKVLSRDEILNFAWGEDSFPTTRSVDNSILRLRQSLGAQGSGWIRSVRSVGYQWLEPQTENSQGNQTGEDIP